MLTDARLPLVLHLLAMALVSVGCSGGEDDAESELVEGTAMTGADGQVVDPWSAYCVATFTTDYAVDDGFGETQFTARAGARYLLTDLSETDAEIAYLTPLGPSTMSVGAAPESGALPFTSNCMPSATVRYYAVFTDVDIYADEALTTLLCEFPAGTVLPSDGMGPAGFAASSFEFSGPATYELMLNSLAPQCGNAATGYVSVPETRVFDANTWLVPVQTIIGPASLAVP